MVWIEINLMFLDLISKVEDNIEIHGCQSTECTINLGVLQGFILGPLLFLVYIEVSLSFILLYYLNGLFIIQLAILCR